LWSRKKVTLNFTMGRFVLAESFFIVPLWRRMIFTNYLQHPNKNLNTTNKNNAACTCLYIGCVGSRQVRSALSIFLSSSTDVYL
jgi:hypothetical protein